MVPPRAALSTVVLLALASALAPSAFASNRYASPVAMGTGDCLSESNSCDLPMAVSGAGANDDIFVRGDMGAYSLSSLVTNANAINLHGTRGRPQLIFSTNRLKLEPGSSAENLYVQTSGALNVQLYGSTANNLITKHTGNRHAIFMEESTLTNSVAWSPVGTQALELDGSNTLRNVTAYAPADGAAGILAFGRATAGPFTDSFVNVIARGGSGGAGILATQEDPADLTINVSNSNYSSAQIDPASDTTKVRFNLASTNQTAAPLFADAAGGDFHQAPGSPTIDKGANSPANGATDFDGGARTLNGLTDIGADEFIPGSGPPPSIPPQCTNPTTLLVTCADFTGSAGFCRAGDGLTIFGGAIPPQCLNPVTPRTQCSNFATGRGTVCYQTTPGQRPNVGSCASMGQALPECNVPNREVPTGCQGVLFTNYSFCSPTEQAVAATYCPPSTNSGVPACNFPTTVTPPSKPRGATATASARRKTLLTVTIGCPKVLAKPRCRGTIAVDSLRTSLLRTLTNQARFSASTYRLFVPGLAGFAAPFEKSATAIAKRVLGGRKLPKAVNPAKVVAELGPSDAQTTSFAASLQRAVKEYRKLAGRSKKKRGKPGATRSTTFKRYRLKSGRKRTRVKVRLSARTLRSLRREAGKGTSVPVRVIVSFKAPARPVVRFVDLALRVR